MGSNASGAIRAAAAMNWIPPVIVMIGIFSDDRGAVRAGASGSVHAIRANNSVGLIIVSDTRANDKNYGKHQAFHALGPSLWINPQENADPIAPIPRSQTAMAGVGPARRCRRRQPRGYGDGSNGLSLDILDPDAATVPKVLRAFLMRRRKRGSFSS
jgi:hypothetical protein